jgi:hypothetical protein
MSTSFFNRSFDNVGFSPSFFNQYFDNVGPSHSFLNWSFDNVSSSLPPPHPSLFHQYVYFSMLCLVTAEERGRSWCRFFWSYWYSILYRSAAYYLGWRWGGGGGWPVKGHIYVYYYSNFLFGFLNAYTIYIKKTGELLKLLYSDLFMSYLYFNRYLSWSHIYTIVVI